MGRARRWIMQLLGIKKEKEKQCQKQEQGEKKRWSFGKSGRSTAAAHVPANITDAVWLRSYISETEKEQSKHAIAVAAATAAAADAAVAAAQAAVAVVRLTSHGRGTMMFHGGRERSAALKVQSVFKGYLARKALRALKGLVKLQALVRGFLVRKRAAATLHSMQALFRAQTAVRSQRARRSFTQDTRRSIEKNGETRSEFPSKRLSTSHETWCNHAFDDIPKIVRIDTCNTRSRSSRRINTIDYPATLSPRKYQDFEWIFNGRDECRLFSTAQSTPRFANSVLRSNIAPGTPAKSVCGDIMFRPYSNHPSYMANTQSFNAKLRSHSAPKQRPEPGPKRRLSLQEIMASRASLSGVKMQRSCSHVQETLNS